MGKTEMLDTNAVFVASSFATFNGPLVRRMTAVTRDPTTAEDLAQEAFVRLVREIEAGRTPDDVGAWLHRVATNLAMSRGRHLAVAGRHTADLVSRDVAPAPDASAIETEMNSALAEALSTLPRDTRNALLLAARGYQGPEIADLIGRTPGATRTLLCRARAQLREHLTIAGFAAA